MPAFKGHATHLVFKGVVEERHLAFPPRARRRGADPHRHVTRRHEQRQVRAHL